MSLLDRLRECDRHDLAVLVPFRVAGRSLGWVRPALAGVLLRHDDVFVRDAQGLGLHPRLDSPPTRTAALARVMESLRRAGLLHGWWGEPCVVAERWGAEPVLHVERAGLDALGLKSFGVHLNGFVRTSRGVLLWLARRARDRGTFPGQWDHLAAGGQPAGLGLRENMIKECAEEAGVSKDLARRMTSAGALAYRCDLPSGLNDDTIFCFDLEVPPEFSPRNIDGEVEAFELAPVASVVERLRSSHAFKFNVGPVILDFLLRHELLPRADAEYDAVARTLDAWRLRA